MFNHPQAATPLTATPRLCPTARRSTLAPSASWSWRAAAWARCLRRRLCWWRAAWGSASATQVGASGVQGACLPGVMGCLAATGVSAAAGRLLVCALPARALITNARPFIQLSPLHPSAPLSQASRLRSPPRWRLAAASCSSTSSSSSHCRWACFKCCVGLVICAVWLLPTELHVLSSLRSALVQSCRCRWLS